MGTREFIAFFFTSALFFSCASTGVSGGVSTFVDTTLSEDNSVNTSCVFTKIHSVSYVDGTEAESFHLFGSGSGVVIPKKSYSYDSVSGTIVFSDESALKSGRVFRIRGEYENPPVIILNGNVSGEPLVMVGGKSSSPASDSITTPRRCASLSAISSTSIPIRSSSAGSPS